MRLKSCRPSPWCIQSDWAEKSFTYMPSLPGRHVGRLRLGVLARHALPGREVESKDLLVSAERMQLRPAIEVLEGIVRPVVCSPTEEGLQVAALVVVLLEELPARGKVVGQELALEPRPCGGGHRRIDDDGDGRGRDECHAEQQGEETAARHGAMSRQDSTIALVPLHVDPGNVPCAGGLGRPPGTRPRTECECCVESHSCGRPRLSSVAGGASGQTTSGTIRGRVLDPQGAPVRSVTVTVTGQGNAVTRTVTTDADGIFVVSNLPPGRVDLAAVAAGFNDALAQGHRARRRSNSLPGSQSRRSAPCARRSNVDSPIGVDTSRSVVDAVIPTSLIDALPLNGRNFLELALLVPGNTPAPNFDPTKTNSVTISSAGQLGRGGNIMIDGADNNDDVVGGTLQNVTQEAVQEFQIATNRFSAESGRSAASVINIVTKSGSDQFRGSASIFLRDNSWQALPATYDRSSGEDVPFDRQQLAGSAGGPLMARRSFWFGAMEYRNQDGAVLVGARDVASRTIRQSFALAPLDDLLGSGRIDWRPNAVDGVTVRYAGERADDTGREHARPRDRFRVAAPGQREPVSVGGWLLDANLDRQRS